MASEESRMTPAPVSTTAAATSSNVVCLRGLEPPLAPGVAPTICLSCAAILEAGSKPVLL